MSFARGGLVLGLSLSMEAVVLYHAFHYGLLSGLPQWDDCGIILRGLSNLDRLEHATSVYRLLRALHLEIHAPLADLQTIMGLLLSGGDIHGPYLLSATWLALLLWGILKTYSGRDRVLSTIVVALVLIQPLTLNTLEDLKSDWAGGLLTAGALFVMTRGAQTQRSDLKLFGSVLLGLAVLSKLTAFYMPIIAIGVVLLLELYSVGLQVQRRPATSAAAHAPPGPFRRQGGILDAGVILQALELRSLGWRALIAAGPFLLFFLASLGSIVSYIGGAMSSTWKDGLTVPERLQYYGPLGTDSWTEWGNLHIFLLVFAAPALLLAWRRRERALPLALLVHACVAAMFLLPLAVAPASNHSWASPLVGVALSAMLLSVDYLVRSMPASGGLAVGAVALLVALPAPLPLKTSAYYSQFPVTSAELRQYAGTYEQIVDAMIVHSRRPSPHIVVFYDLLFAPHPNLAIGYFHRTGQLPVVQRVDKLSDVSAAALRADADYALTIVPSRGATQVRGLFPLYPISQDPGSAENVVHAAGFLALGTFAVPGGEIHLYSGLRQ